MILLKGKRCFGGVFGEHGAVVSTQPEYLRIALPLEAIADVCRRYAVSELAVFGSVLRPDFSTTSDLDFLVRFQNDDSGPWMSKLTEMEQDLAHLLGRQVDVVSWRGIEQSRNRIRRDHIRRHARRVYEYG